MVTISRAASQLALAIYHTLKASALLMIHKLSFTCQLSDLQLPSGIIILLSSYLLNLYIPFHCSIPPFQSSDCTLPCTVDCLPSVKVCLGFQQDLHCSSASAMHRIGSILSIPGSSSGLCTRELKLNTLQFMHSRFVGHPMSTVSIIIILFQSKLPCHAKRNGQTQ